MLQHLLIIQGLRYNSQFQFVKHNPLGNGMSGKCHLASDWETNHNFCIKEVTLQQYLNLNNTTKLYIDLGTKICFTLDHVVCTNYIKVREYI